MARGHEVLEADDVGAGTREGRRRGRRHVAVILAVEQEDRLVELIGASDEVEPSKVDRFALTGETARPSM